jgi:hypothetical protein
MTTYASATSNPNLLKTIYGKESLTRVTRELSVFASDIEWEYDDGGDDLRPTVVDISPGGGVSPTFSVAQSTANTTTQRKFVYPLKNLYGVKFLDGEMIDRTIGDDMAYGKIVDHEMRALVQTWNEALSASLWSRAGGSVCQFTSASVTITNAYFTPAITSDSQLFEIGRQYEFATDDGTATSPAGVLDGGATLTCTGVDSAGKVTFGAAINTIAGMTNACYIFPAGSYGKSGTGVPGFIPITAPSSSESFLGVDRSEHWRLGGLRYAPGVGLKTDILRDALAYAGVRGCKPTRIYMNDVDCADVAGELGSYTTIPVGTQDVTIGHKGIAFMAGGKSVALVAESWVPKGYCWALTPETWKLTWTKRGEVPRLIDDDGVKKFLRAPTADAFEARLVGRGRMLRCLAPGKNMVVSFA